MYLIHCTLYFVQAIVCSAELLVTTSWKMRDKEMSSVLCNEGDMISKLISTRNKVVRLDFAPRPERQG